MRKIGKFVDMKREPDKTAPDAVTVPWQPEPSPAGLCICLSDEELKKLDLDDKPEVGDVIHLFALARVTHASSTERFGSEKESRVELQITHLALESEDAENEAADAAPKKARRRYMGDGDEAGEY